MPWLSQQSYPLPHSDLLTWAFDHRTYDPDKPIYYDLDNLSRNISWRQGRSLARQTIAGLRKAGLRPGDCVSIASFNDIMYSIMFLGIVGVGGIFAGTNPAYTSYEVRHHIQTTQAKFFIVEPELLETVLKAVREEGLPAEDRIFVFNVRGQAVPEGFRSWEWLLGHGEEDWVRFDDIETCKKTEVARLMTSGTTGLPKTAMQSHYNATSFHTMSQEIGRPPWEPRNIYPLPMFHVATVPAVHASPFRSGNVAFIMRRFELEAFLAAIERHQINNLGIVPPLVIAIIMSPLTKNYSLKSIKRVGCGAAPLDKGSQARFKALCGPGCTFTQVLGMTETTGAISLFYYPDDDDTGSVGKQFMPNTDVKLIDDNGNDITGYDVEGELCVRGPTVFPGYFNNPKANAESYDAEGFFETGDIVYRDGKSKLWYIVDRKKELIKVRGFQVAPPELEEVLLSHPDIVDAAVIGVELSGDGAEFPRAYIVPRPEAPRRITVEEVKSLMAERLASYKQLVGGIRFVNEIPKSPSGKILKRILREEAQKELQRQAKL